MKEISAGFAIGPSKLNEVGMPSSLRVGPACRNAGWNTGANANPIPASVTHRATPSPDCSSTTPSCSSTSAVPHLDDDARLPCLHTGTPAPATTSAAIVETFTECDASPPVPTMSIARAATSFGNSIRPEAARTASSIPPSSSAVSPFERSATRNAAICAEVASPARIDSIAPRVWSAPRSARDVSCASSVDQPPTRSIALIA